MKGTSQKITTKDILGQHISREEAIARIQLYPEAYEKFLTFPVEYQNQVLEFIQGIRGLPVLYDNFFKKILDPVATPERLERFLSSLLNQKIRIVRVLTREGTQLVEQGTLVIMDILVETEDGSFINVEMQKHGYDFTGERSTCYISDLIMRQYNRVKSEKKENFSFKDMKSVYLIVLMEKSSKNFKSVYPSYIHRSQHSFDTGAEMNFLTNFIYISLDTFGCVSQNISNYLDAWLTFLSSDSPEDIIRLVEAYPEFKTYYHDIAMFRKKPKELMNMYSEALLEMDRNTVKYMIEEMKKEAEELAASIVEKEQTIVEREQAIIEKEQVITEKEQVITEKEQVITEKEQVITEKEQLIATQEQALADKDAMIAELQRQLEKVKK